MREKNKINRYEVVRSLISDDVAVTMKNFYLRVLDTWQPTDRVAAAACVEYMTQFLNFAYDHFLLAS